MACPKCRARHFYKYLGTTLSGKATTRVLEVETTQTMENREFEIFVRQCRSKLLTTAREYIPDIAEAEDVVQDALLKLYAMRHRLDEQRSPEALAATIVRHLAIDALRHKQRHPEVALNTNIIDSTEEYDERIRAVLKLMDGLPSKQQIILRMKHIEGLECEQIAQIVGVSIDAVYQNLCRARRAILKEFKQRNYEQ